MWRPQSFSSSPLRRRVVALWRRRSQKILKKTKPKKGTSVFERSRETHADERLRPFPPHCTHIMLAEHDTLPHIRPDWLLFLLMAAAIPRLARSLAPPDYSHSPEGSRGRRRGAFQIDPSEAVTTGITALLRNDVCGRSSDRPILPPAEVTAHFFHVSEQVSGAVAPLALLQLEKPALTASFTLRVGSAAPSVH